MVINFTLDTSQPSDLATLATLSAAFGGTPAPVSAPAPDKKAVKPDAPKADTTAAGAPRATIEQVRNEAKLHDKDAVKAEIKKLGFDALADVPADRLAELLTNVKALPGK